MRGRVARDVLQFCSASPNAENQPGHGRWRDRSPLGNVDVVDVLDAFWAKRKRQPKVIFNVEPWRIGTGYYVTVTMPGSESRRITETFKTEGEAWRWNRNESIAWLHSQSQVAAK